MKEQVVKTHKSGIVYEPSRLGKSQRAIAPELFEASYWIECGLANQAGGGRGGVVFIGGTEPRWVLRHYRRGGLIARLCADRYLWRGAGATRAFREWRLLAQLHAAGLPVPAPVAARYVRDGIAYRADLITEELPQTRSLAQTLSEGTLSAEQWRSIGVTLARFHRFGAHHADLNAHNILLSLLDTQQIYLLDFDRGRLRRPGAWQEAVLARLLRSLRKIKTQQPQLNFDAGDWTELLAGYAQLSAGNSPDNPHSTP